MHACMNPHHRLEVWCDIHMHRQLTLAPCGDFWFQSTVPHQSCSIVYSNINTSIHMFGPHACSGSLRGLATCVIIGELAHLWGCMDGHHFVQQQERGCTTKVDYSWSVL